MSLPTQLYLDGFCSKPVVFARNAVVVVVPSANPAHIHTIYDLAKPGVTVEIAAPGVPVGIYARQVLHNMKLAAAVMHNVVSQETDVRAILAKVTLGEVDAGFVYSTDAKTVPGQVKVIRVPVWAQPNVKYGICVVSASANKPAAEAFIKRVIGPVGQKKLHAYGFLPR
jgi:molybdate transport system substrate-binding protein